MHELVTGLLLASCMLPVAVGGMRIASDLSERNATHSFANLQAEPLWTSDVKRILPGEQAYERLPAAKGLNVQVADNRETQRILLTVQPVSPVSIPDAPYSSDNPRTEVGQNEWCAARYRSYDPIDNTYQPFGGRSRQPCSPPAGRSVGALPAAFADNGDLGSPDAHVR